MKPVRRVIIGQALDDQSHIFSDKHASNIDHFITGIPEAVSINLWATDCNPSPLEPWQDPTFKTIPFLPTPNGTIFRICDIPPDSSFINKLDDVLLNNQKLTEEQKHAKHPMMHQVSVLSYAIVLDGEVTLIVDTDKTILTVGDVVIDHGSHHAWSNHTSNICRMMFVLLDAKAIYCSTQNSRPHKIHRD